MSIRDLRITFPPNPDQQTDIVRLTGERTTGEDWQPFTATVIIDWERLAEYYAQGGRKIFGNAAITVDSRLYNPKEAQTD
jgi:hypothetical protein